METALITAFATIVSVSVTALVTYLTQRRAAATAETTAKAANQVEASADNREWAKLWMDRAEKAEKRADNADIRAGNAEQRTAELDVRCDELEAKLLRLAAYTRKLQAEMVAHNWTPPDPPDDLRPPL